MIQFTAQDIKLVNANVANFQKVVPGGGLGVPAAVAPGAIAAPVNETYTADITATNDGLVTVNIDSASFTNAKGFCNNGGFFSYTYDSTGPIFTLKSNNINQHGLINGNVITLSITTNELATEPDVNKFDINVNGVPSNATFGPLNVNTATQTIGNHATNWTVDISNIDADADGDYEILIDAGASKDIVGNDSLLIDTNSPNKLQFTRDTVPPEVTTIVAEGVDNGEVTNKNQIKLTFTLNKINTTFDINSLESLKNSGGFAIDAGLAFHTFKPIDDNNFSVLLDITTNENIL